MIPLSRSNLSQLREVSALLHQPTYAKSCTNQLLFSLICNLQHLNYCWVPALPKLPWKMHPIIGKIYASTHFSQYVSWQPSHCARAGTCVLWFHYLALKSDATIFNVPSHEPIPLFVKDTLPSNPSMLTTSHYGSPP
jgi:hypothetical protein